SETTSPVEEATGNATAVEPETAAEPEPHSESESEDDVESVREPPAEDDKDDGVGDAPVDNLCPRCGAASLGEDFCTSCGLALRSTAEVDTATVALAWTGQPANDLFGQMVAVRTLSRAGRALRTEPADDAPILPVYTVGKCTVIAVDGDWVLL